MTCLISWPGRHLIGNRNHFRLRASAKTIIIKEKAQVRLFAGSISPLGKMEKKRVLRRLTGNHDN